MHPETAGVHGRGRPVLRTLRKHFTEHDFVAHGKGKYVQWRHSFQTVEGLLFPVFKRGMKGVYQHCSEKHLYRYVAEFDFRYNNRVRLGVDDANRADRALKGIVGKRLTYRPAVRS